MCPKDTRAHFGICIARGVCPKGIFGPNDSMASARHCGSQLIMPDTPGQDMLKSLVLFTTARF